MPVADSDFLSACRCEPVARTPVWFMRQAGRSLPEYRALRGDGSILDAIARPGARRPSSRCQPVRRYGVDAAILFSDIVVPIAAIGFGVDDRPGRRAPSSTQPFRSDADLATAAAARSRRRHALRHSRPSDASSPLVDVPVIGFAGAPFTRGELPRRGRAVP